MGTTRRRRTKRTRRTRRTTRATTTRTTKRRRRTSPARAPTTKRRGTSPAPLPRAAAPTTRGRKKCSEIDDDDIDEFCEVLWDEVCSKKKKDLSDAQEDLCDLVDSKDCDWSSGDGARASLRGSVVVTE